MVEGLFWPKWNTFNRDEHYAWPCDNVERALNKHLVRSLCIVMQMTDVKYCMISAEKQLQLIKLCASFIRLYFSYCQIFK